MFDIGIVGGGVMGSMTALILAEAGMKVLLVEQFGLGSGASGVNAGTLSLQIKRTSLMAYAMRGADLWEGMSARLDYDVHHRRSGGLNLAFTEDEAQKLHQVMSERIEAGLPLDFIDGFAVRQREPALTDKVRLASYSPLDGFASASLTGRAFRKALPRLGVELREFTPVTGLRQTEAGYDIVTPGEAIPVRRLVLASGAWISNLLAMLGLSAPIVQRVNQMAVTERTTRRLNGVVGHISGLMSLKQADNGTVLIGGGWQGKGHPGEPGNAIPDNLRNNLRFAQLAMPALEKLRLVRTWYGYDCFVPDVMPMVGALPGHEHAYMIGCVRGGYTIGPCMGELLALNILQRQADLSITGFDPARYITPIDAVTHG